MQFTTKLRSQKAFVLEANATGMNTAKIQQFVFVFLVFAFFFFFESRKTTRSSKHNRKTYCF